MADGTRGSAGARIIARTSIAFLAVMSAPALSDSNPDPAAHHLVRAGPDLEGRPAVPIRADRFQAELARALQDASASPRLQRMIAPARSLSRDRQLAYVQSEVHRAIGWRSDATEWGRHDYWASAAETLERGFGDMEDRAILKMQALRALGFPAGDLFLTHGRDRVGGPLTVLLARIDGRYFLLDDTGGVPVALGRRAHEFQPLISFSYSGSWAHLDQQSQALASTQARASATRSPK